MKNFNFCATLRAISFAFMAFFILCLSTFLVVGSSAQTANPSNLTETTQTANPALLSSESELQQLAEAENKNNYKYSVEDFSNSRITAPDKRYFQLSPDGVYLSYIEQDTNYVNILYLKNTSTDKISQVITDDNKNFYLADFQWINNNQIMLVVHKKNAQHELNLHLYVINRDGSNLRALTPFEGVSVQNFYHFKDQPNYIIAEMNKDKKNVDEPYKINIVTGEIEKLFENNNLDLSNNFYHYMYDKKGNLRAYFIESDEKRSIYYKNRTTNKFEESISYQRLDQIDKNFMILEFLDSDNKSDEAYVLSNLNSNTDEILVYNLATKR